MTGGRAGSNRRRRLVPLALGLVILPLGVVLLGQDTPAVAPSRGVLALAAAGETAQAWEARVDGMTRAGRLRLVSSVADTMLEGRVHDRFDQYAGEVRIVGGQVLLQRSAAGVETVFGRLYPDDLGIDLRPSLSAAAAVERVRSLTGGAAVGAPAPELVVLPLDDGVFRLVWQVEARRVGDAFAVLVDANTGGEVRRITRLETQAAVGIGTGVRGERRKLPTRQASGVFFAEDLLRPESHITYDLKSDHVRAQQMVSGFVSPGQADVAADSDNRWTDGPVVDAHAGVGVAYDYFFARFGRRGGDGFDGVHLRVMVHPARRDNIGLLPQDVVNNFVFNAFYCFLCGTGGTETVLFGDGVNPPSSVNGQNVDSFAAGLDVVAHEYAHGVMHHTADLIYVDESGALNESFSDIMGTGAEFYAAANGRLSRPGNYVMAEDVYTARFPGAVDGLRSLENPGRFGHPDHYAKRVIGGFDSGGVHTNSGISNHAFYLAIEGGTNRTSGLAVQGVGAANREQIERIFYRGYTSYLTHLATFADARRATLQAARDLYGESGPAFRAVTQAWTAVGVN